MRVRLILQNLIQIRKLSMNLQATYELNVVHLINQELNVVTIEIKTV